MRLARVVAAFSLALFIIGGMVHAAPQSGAGRKDTTAPAVQGSAAGTQVVAVPDRDAAETRDQLEAVLRRYPPNVGHVLKLDTSLLSNSSYLSSYPALASFLTTHPEVAHNPGYYLGGVSEVDYSTRRADPRAQAMDVWRDVLGWMGAFFIFMPILLALVWLIRTLLDWRRWTRLARVQADVHTKLLDRFTANEDLLAYIQTPAGRRFLESGPVLAEAGPQPLGAPVSRILWSAQAGIVLTAAGLGLEFASGRVVPEVSEGLVVMGILAIALGLGFVISAAAAWVISRRMGLFEPLAGHGNPA